MSEENSGNITEEQKREMLREALGKIAEIIEALPFKTTHVVDIGDNGGIVGIGGLPENNVMYIGGNPAALVVFIRDIRARLVEGGMTEASSRMLDAMLDEAEANGALEREKKTREELADED